MAANKIPSTAIHQKEETIEKIVPARQILQQQILIEATSLPGCLTHPLWMGLGFLRCLQVEMRGAISTVFLCWSVMIAAFPGFMQRMVSSGEVFLSLNLIRLFLFLTYLERLGLLVECRDLGFRIDSLANGLGRFRKVLESFDLGRRIDELKEQKAAIIVEESNIEGELWWDLGSIDKLMSRSLVSWQDLW
ncbi:hypothetical protein POTOM_033448 [Populus tomentosa]|uniref:Uncharacterized protein n=1 Tax=Populus tomentosa TaxID=118781 RepID=A0A8X8CHL2_POPTO|nr:hypothetical protein POTOM_033448 [Populus tomentosa]